MGAPIARGQPMKPETLNFIAATTTTRCSPRSRLVASNGTLTYTAAAT